MQITIQEMSAVPQEFDAQVRDLYERSFHPAELRSYDDMLASLGTDDVLRTRLIMAWQGDRVLGLSLFKYHAQPGFGYLWYLCVGQDTRGLGIGGKLYNATLDDLKRISEENGSGLKCMMFEVERMDAESHPEYGDPIKRMRFYDRMGARMITGYDYRQPPIPPHDEVLLQLMVHPLNMPEESYTADELAALVRDFVQHCQGETAGPTVDLKLCQWSA